MTSDVHSRTAKTVEQLDTERRSEKAIAYLNKVEEARQWIEDIVGEKDIFKVKINVDGSIEGDLSTQKTFELSLRHGEMLVNLINMINRKLKITTQYVPFENEQLQYRHTDNINFFKAGVFKLGLSRIYEFDTLDCYNGKFTYQVIYFIHALSIFLHLKYNLKKIGNLSGSVTFKDEDIEEKMVITEELPSFDNLAEDINLSIQSVDIPSMEINGSNSEKTKVVYFNTEDDIIKNTFRYFLNRAAFKALNGETELSPFLLSHFLPLYSSKRGVYIAYDSYIERSYNKLYNHIEKIYNMEVTIENIGISTSLVLNNKVRTSHLCKKIPSVEDILSLYTINPTAYDNIIKVLYLCQTEPVIIAMALRTFIHENTVREINLFIIQYVIPLFSFSNIMREENLLLNLIEYLNSLDDQENFFNSYREDIIGMFSRELLKYYFLNSTSFKILIKEFDSVIERLNFCSTYNMDSGHNVEHDEISDAYYHNLNETFTIFCNIFENNFYLFPLPIKYYYKRMAFENNENFIDDILLLILYGFTNNSLTTQLQSNSQKTLNDFIEIIKINYKKINDIIVNFEENEPKDDSFLKRPVVSFKVSAINQFIILLKNSIQFFDEKYSDLKKNSTYKILQFSLANNFAPVFSILSRLIKKCDTIADDENRIVDFYLSKPVFIKKNAQENLIFKKNIIVASHIPGRTMRDILLNNEWVEDPELDYGENEITEEIEFKNTEEKKALKEKKMVFSNIYGLFFCPIYNDIIGNQDYCADITFYENYRNLRSDILSKYDEEDETIAYLFEDYTEPTVSQFKDDLLNRFYKLEKENLITHENNYDDVLRYIANEILYLKRNANRRHRELLKIQGLSVIYKNKEAILQRRLTVVENYFNNLIDNLISKNFEKNIRFSAEYLRRYEILEEISLPSSQNDNFAGINFILTHENSNEFKIDMSVLQVLRGRLVVKFDQLLLMNYKNVKHIFINVLEKNEWVAKLNVTGLIGLINKHYFTK